MSVSVLVVTDVDECSVDIDTCDTEHGVCHNTMGAYTCNCQQGWMQLTSATAHTCVKAAGSPTQGVGEYIISC